MKSILICVLTVCITAGCSTYSGMKYSISPENVTTLRTLNIENLNVGEFTSFEPGLKKINCRAVGPITPPDGNTFADYIRESLITELQIAEDYSPEAPITLSGHLENIDFDSQTGIWYTALTVKSSNGVSISINEEYKYETSFFADVGCSQTAQALMPSVQNIINKIITNPKFTDMVKY